MVSPKPHLTNPFMPCQRPKVNEKFMTDHIKSTSLGPLLRLVSAAALSLVLSACQMPSYSPPSGPSSPSSSGGGSSGGSTSSPSGSSGGSNGGMPSPGGGQGADSGSQNGDRGENKGADSGNQSGDSGNNGADSGGTGSQSGSDSAGGSAGDSLEDLDQALDESLEGFDDNVGAQGSDSAEIDILSPTGGGGGVQSDSEAPLFEEADAMAEANAEIESRAAEGPGVDAANGADGDSAPEGQVGAGSSGTAANDIIPIPEDIDDGQGDDIVLRQIRDAAMKEKDPVLREKLWDEYRRIKNQ